MLEHYIMKLLFMKQKTKTDFCVDLGVSRQTYYNWMRGTHVPTRRYIRKMASLLSDNDEEYYQIGRQIWILVWDSQFEGPKYNKELKTNEK